MAEFFETRIENIEKSIPPSIPSRNRKKSKKKKKGVTFNDSDDEDSDEKHKGKKFCQYHDTFGHTTDECITLNALVK